MMENSLTQYTIPYTRIEKRIAEKEKRKCSHLKKINKRHAGNSVQSIQIKDGKKRQNTSNRRTVSIFIYANKNHSFRSISIFLFVLANLNLSSARCQHRFDRDNRAFKVPRTAPRRVIYSNVLVKCAIFPPAHGISVLFHTDDGHWFTPSGQQANALIRWPWAMAKRGQIHTNYQ